MQELSHHRKTALKVALFWGSFWLLLFVLRALPFSFFKEWVNLVFGSAGVGLSIMLVTLFLKNERKKFADIGLIWEYASLRKFAFGTVCGMTVVGVMLFVMIIFASLSVELAPNPDYWNAISYSALVLFALASMEEIIFRSYPLVRLSESFGIRAAIYVTSVFFAFYHGLSPLNLLGPGVWGLFFGISAIVSRGIAVPLGFHFGLNWMQSFFGMKLQYASSIWIIVPGVNDGLISTDTLGLLLQLILLVLGVVVIEIYIRKNFKAAL